jgi:hypothetical protein
MGEGEAGSKGEGLASTGGESAIRRSKQKCPDLTAGHHTVQSRWFGGCTTLLTSPTAALVSHRSRQWPGESLDVVAEVGLLGGLTVHLPLTSRKQKLDKPSKSCFYCEYIKGNNDKSCLIIYSLSRGFPTRTGRKLLTGGQLEWPLVERQIQAILVTM